MRSSLTALNAHSTARPAQAPAARPAWWDGLFSQLHASRNAPERPAYARDTYSPSAAARASREDAHARRGEWFISQVRGMFNPYEDTPENANCGPASLTMVARAFGRIAPTLAGADAAVEQTRRRMGEGQGEMDFTSSAGLLAGARSYGLRAERQIVDSTDDLRQELAQGKLLIANVVPKYFGEQNTKGHWTVVTAVRDGAVHLSDPLGEQGPIAISEQEFWRAMQAQNTYAVISVGA